MGLFPHNRLALLALPLIISGFPTLLGASEATPVQTSIRSVPLPNGNRVVEFCEADDCRPYGRPDGYTADEWKEIEKLCNFLGYMGGPAQTAADTLTIGAVAVGSIVSLGVVTGLVMLAAGAQKSAARFDAKSYGTAGDLLPGLNSGNDHFPLGFRDFEKLDQGLESCTRKYNTLMFIGCVLGQNPGYGFLP